MNIETNNQYLNDLVSALGFNSSFSKKVEFQNNFIILNEQKTQENFIDINSYGILKSNKLLFREPILLSNLKFFSSEDLSQIKKFESNETVSINSIKENIFYSIQLNEINHKYLGSIFFTQDLDKSTTVIFPTDNQIVIISKSVGKLKKYKKIFDSNNINQFEYKKIQIPTKIELKQSKNKIKNIQISEESFLEISCKLADIIIHNLSSKDLFVPSTNKVNFMTTIFILGFNFMPSFIVPYLLRFLQRDTGSYIFCKQLLGLNYFITSDNFIYSDEGLQNNLTLGKGSKIINFSLNKNNKTFSFEDIFTAEKNILTSSISINNHNDINKVVIDKDNYSLRAHVYDFLNLEKFTYLVSNTGLILEIFSNDLIDPFLSIKKEPEVYFEVKQSLIDDFEVSQFQPKLPNLPKIKISNPLKLFKKP